MPTRRHFLYDSTAVTSGLQTLSLGADSIYGGSFGLTLVFGHLGIQATYLAFSPDVSGTSSADALAVRYTSLQPPDDTPVVVDFNGSIPMSDPSGELREKTFSLDGFYRFVLPGWFSLDLSAGLTWFNVDGDIGTLDYLEVLAGRTFRPLSPINTHSLMEVESLQPDRGQRGRDLELAYGDERRPVDRGPLLPGRIRRGGPELRADRYRRGHHGFRCRDGHHPGREADHQSLLSSASRPGFQILF